MKVTTRKGKSLAKSLTIVLGATAGVAAANAATTVAHADTISADKDTDLKTLAKEKHVAVADLAKANKVDEDHQVKKGDKIDVPDTYTVQKGDTVSEIAKNLDIDTKKLLKANNLTWQNATITVGQELKLPNSDDQNNKNSQKQTETTTQQSTTAQAPNAGTVVGNAVQLAHMGIPYVWGGSTLSGFDCSGLVQYVEAQAGVSVGRNTVAQEANTVRKSVSEAQPGDLLFWGTPGASHHVAIYIGNGQYVHAPAPGQNVTIGSISSYAPDFAGTIVK